MGSDSGVCRPRGCGRELSRVARWRRRLHGKPVSLFGITRSQIKSIMCVFYTKGVLFPWFLDYGAKVQLYLHIRKYLAVKNSDFLYIECFSWNCYVVRMSNNGDICNILIVSGFAAV